MTVGDQITRFVSLIFLRSTKCLYKVYYPIVFFVKSVSRLKLNRLFRLEYLTGRRCRSVVIPVRKPCVRGRWFLEGSGTCRGTGRAWSSSVCQMGVCDILGGGVWIFSLLFVV